VRELSPQARAARALHLARLKKEWAQEQPERAQRIQEQWNLVLHELEKQPEWGQLKSRQQLEQGQEEQVRRFLTLEDLAPRMRWGQAEQQQIRRLPAVRKNTIITLLSRFLQERACSEWVGDLYEIRTQWQKQGLTPWGINLRTLGVALHLLFAQSRCIVYDRIFARYWGKPL
jgi:hypothetical protein